jgi:putative transposase
MILTYRYRLLPSKRQHRALTSLLETQRQLYNAGLEERIDCYRKTGKNRTFIDQCKALTACRHDLVEMGAFPVNLQRWTLKRLDEAFQGFFRRAKARHGKAGFPRFRGKGWWDSFGFAEFSGIRFDGKRLRFAGMCGGLKVHLHRALPEDADIRSCVFRRDGRGWHVSFAVAIEAAEKRTVATMVGIDLGLKVFAYCSDGVILPNQQIARRAQKELRRRQRALARCKRGSKRRRKVRARLAQLHRKIANTRNRWLHQQSAALVKRADLIAVEDLNVQNMIKHPTLARSIADASWSKFLSMLAYKAEKAGGHLIRIDPRNTSQRCSGCAELVLKLLAVRTHSCPSCDLVIDRDWNASLNILRAGMPAGWIT